MDTSYRMIGGPWDGQTKEDTGLTLADTTGRPMGKYMPATLLDDVRVLIWMPY